MEGSGWELTTRTTGAGNKLSAAPLITKKEAGVKFKFPEASLVKPDLQEVLA